MDDENALRKYIQRGCTDRPTRDILLSALDAGAEMRRTTKGVLVYGPEGTVTAHMSNSNYRAAKNLTARLRRAGVGV